MEATLFSTEEPVKKLVRLNILNFLTFSSSNCFYFVLIGCVLLDSLTV